MLDNAITVLVLPIKRYLLFKTQGEFMKTQNVVSSFLLSLGLLTSSVFAKVDERGCCNTSPSCSTQCNESAFNCSNSCEDSCGHSRTILIPRSITYDSTYELSLANYDIYHSQTRIENECKRLSIYQTKFFQRSRDNKNRLNSYFLPNGLSTVAINEDGTGDINSLWFNLLGVDGEDFSGRFRVKPQRELFGDHFNLHLDLDEWYCGTWLGLQTALLWARNELRLSVCDETAAECVGGVNSIQTALNSPKLHYGKFGCKKKRWKFGVDDVQFKTGKDWFFCDRESHVGLYAVLGIPMGSDPSADFLFQTNIGSSHANLGVGLNADYGIWDCDTMEVNVMLDVKYQYVFRSIERRSFDLISGGDFSRYLQVVSPNQPLFSQPLVNFLTLPVQITPRSTVQVWVASHLSRCDWEFELGYNFWYREAEQVKVDCDCLCKNLGILDINGLCNANPTTASMATISEPTADILSDAVFTPIDFATNIDYNSGLQGRSITNKVYAAAGYNTCICNIPTLLGIGGSYEFARKCEYPLENWAIWLKGGTHF